MADKLSISSLKGNLTNPQRVYMWNIVIPAPVGGGDSETLLLRARSTNIPGESVGQIVIPYKQTAGFAVPGKRTLSHTWTCQYVEGEDEAVITALRAWLQQAVNNEGVSAGDEAIKQDVYLVLLSTKGEETRKIKLLGCYVQDIAEAAVSYETEAELLYSVTFSFDDVDEG